MDIEELKDFTVNSELRLHAFCELVSAAFKEYHYLTFPKPRVGESRSLDQNALFHVWATEYAAHLLKKDKKQISEGELEGMKRTLKLHCYRDNSWEWLVTEIKEPFTGQTKTDVRSSAKYKTGEMFQFMEWIQMKAATDGLVLESRGEFKANQERQAA